jgi:hypothetical protein
MSLNLMGVTREELLEFIDYMPDHASMSTVVHTKGLGEFIDEMNPPTLSLDATWDSTPGDGKI